MTERPRRPWERPYNGFTWSERCAATPIQNAALRAGRIVRPTVCSICLDPRSAYPKGRDYRFLHSEDYRVPLTFYSACKKCHAALHARFDNPERWEHILLAFGGPSDWFIALSMNPSSQWQPFDVTYPTGELIASDYLDETPDQTPGQPQAE